MLCLIGGSNLNIPHGLEPVAGRFSSKCSTVWAIRIATMVLPAAKPCLVHKHTPTATASCTNPHREMHKQTADEPAKPHQPEPIPLLSDSIRHHLISCCLFTQNHDT